MAEISGFHNSVNGDRRVKADFFARFFGSLIGNGVFPNPSTGLQVIANGDMTVTVKAGKGWINGVFYENTSDKVITLDVADGVLKRIDRIVLSDITLERDTYIKVKKGTFASTPAAPALQRDADAYELGLADILVSNGVISVTQANITDLRLNNTFCGIVHGVVEQVDTETLFLQYQTWLEEAKIQGEAEFNAWLLELQDVLSGDIAGNLLNLINAHKSDYTLQVPYAGVTAGSVNTYTISAPNISVLLEGMAVSLKFHTDSTGASTLNWCGTGSKPIKKANGMDVTNLKSTGIYTLRYDGVNFILQGEGASGTAVASDLLSGKTASTDAGDITGTMPNRGAVTILPGTANQAIAAGYHNGSGYVVGDADLIPSNILYGKDIFGITGSFSNIKSIQRGYYTYTNKTSVNITISAVDLTKAVCIAYTPAPYSITNHGIESKLTSATNLNLSTATATATSFTVYWTVVEFDNVKTLQKGEYAETVGESTAEHTTAISYVNTAKSLIFASCKSTSSGSGYVYFATNGRFISSYQIAITMPPNTGRTVYWFVVEFN